MNMKVSMGRTVIKYRWPIGIVLWGILIILQIHGSSIGFYAHLLHAPELDTSMYGVSHSFQLDEWAVFTPLSFSQYFTGFSYLNELSRATATNIAVVYGQPCWDVITVFRPFLWGYLFLPVGNGLSFFWTGRLIFLFLVSYEFGVSFFQKDKKLAFGYALLVAFSPIVQWWFNTNSFVEMLIWGQLGVLLIRNYINTDTYIKKTFCIIGLAYCIVAYTVSIYPAWQVSFAYIFLLVGIWYVYTQHHLAAWGRKDILLGIVLIILVILPLSHFIIKAWDAILAFMNTAYPGQRRDLGGGLDISWLFRYSLMYVAPFGWKMGFAPTAAATFISFAPFGVFLAFWQYFKHQVSDSVIWLLIGLLAMYICHFIAIWPEILTKITLLSFVPTGRMMPAIDFIQLLVLFRCLSFHKPVCNKKMTLCIVISYSLIQIWASISILEPMYYYLRATVIVACSACAALYFFRLRKGLILFIVVIAVISGMMDNPVARGVQSVYGSALGQKIEQIADSDHGKWIVDSNYTWDTDYINYMNSYPIMFGAPTINSLNLYPDWGRWDAFPLTGEDKSVLNRYAHMNITLENKTPTTFQNPKKEQSIQDIVNIKLNVEDLNKLGVSYILSERELSSLDEKNVRFQLVDASNGFYIYHVIYDES